MYPRYSYESSVYSCIIEKIVVEYGFGGSMGDTLQYQVYEVTYERSFRTRKKVLEAGISKQEARELVRRYRNSLDIPGMFAKGYGFEEMEVSL